MIITELPSAHLSFAPNRHVEGQSESTGCYRRLEAAVARCGRLNDKESDESQRNWHVHASVGSTVICFPDPRRDGVAAPPVEFGPAFTSPEDFDRAILSAVSKFTEGQRAS